VHSFLLERAWYVSCLTITAINAELIQNVLEMHSRKSQTQRTKISEEFRQGKRIIMFTSDVSARGIDYPDVSLIVQVGLTTREQYIHRVGRTARAGQKGSGVLLLFPFERDFLESLTDLPIKDISQIDAIAKVSHSDKLQCALDAVESSDELSKAAAQAYGSMLG
jgi:ATP-dependent RNA helicase MSS116